MGRLLSWSLCHSYVVMLASLTCWDRAATLPDPQLPCGLPAHHFSFCPPHPALPQGSHSRGMRGKHSIPLTGPPVPLKEIILGLLRPEGKQGVFTAFTASHLLRVLALGGRSSGQPPGRGCRGIVSLGRDVRSTEQTM